MCVRIGVWDMRLVCPHVNKVRYNEMYMSWSTSIQGQLILYPSITIGQLLTCGLYVASSTCLIKGDALAEI